MKTLDLVYPEKSDIPYKIQKFPDGQQNIVILTTNLGRWSKYNEYTYDKIQPILIKSHLNNWLDLELIVCSVASLRELDIEEIHLYTPYIVGARSDRKFDEGGNNYLRDILCPIINSLNFKSITSIDAHSYVLEGCLKNYNHGSLGHFYDWCYNKLPSKDFILISPDAGAQKRVQKAANQMRYKGDIITCSKDRDTEGKLTKTKVPMGHLWSSDKDLIIIDDICDGGATFINIAKEIKNNGYKGKIYLVVTHSIFSKGTTELSHYFDGIYTTNSYKDINALEGLLVKQLNVF